MRSQSYLIRMAEDKMLHIIVAGMVVVVFGDQVNNISPRSKMTAFGGA